MKFSTFVAPFVAVTLILFSFVSLGLTGLAPLSTLPDNKSARVLGVAIDHSSKGVEVIVRLDAIG
jgi:hypothetical protein